MKIIIRPFSEIMIKSKFVRKKYLKILQSNISKYLKKIDENIKVHLFYDKLEVNYLDKNFSIDIIEKLKFIPGIESFIEVESFVLEGLDSQDNSKIFDFIFKKAKEFYLNKIEGKTFVVRIKRSGKHNFRSIDLERYIGGGLLQFSKNSKVQLKNPLVTINIEVKDENLFLVKNEFRGIGGYPVGTQDRIISLISGGFDSGVSTFSMIKRGCKVDYLFFNLGGSAHETGVKQVSKYIWEKFSINYDARFVTIPFEEVIKELLEKIDSKYRGVLLKRLFLKVADLLAQEHNYYAIVKGDSLGQVSSQTLKNMYVIDKASSTLVLRPLISFDKQDIVNISKKIGTYNFACNMPEYCGVISDKPATGASLEEVLDQEEKFDFTILKKAIENKKVEYLKDLFNDIKKENDNIEVVYIPEEKDIIIDIRKKEDIKKRPLNIENNKILEIDFTKINYDFEKLDQTKNYLFYCDKGVLSKLHALYLKEKGFNNIKILRPLKKSCSFKK